MTTSAAALILTIGAFSPAQPREVSREVSAVTATAWPEAEDHRALRTAAFRYLGRPYARGGQGRPAFDCSGFVARVYADVGYTLPRVSRDQARVGRPVDLAALAPGDLLFFARAGQPIRHVAVYLGDGSLIHASSSRGRVMVAQLAEPWFQTHLVSARRILGEDRELSVAGRAVELDEHAGAFRLPPMLRRPARRPRPTYGPELPAADRSSVGARSALVTEDGELGLTLAPELTLVISDWALELALALPVRVPLDGPATIGRFESLSDYLRVFRTFRVGLPDADFELAVSRLGDLTLGSGALVDHLTPATTARGIAGLTLGRSPLSGGLAYRTDDLFFRGIVDDVASPRLIGVGGGVTLGRWTAGVALATDRAARQAGERIAIEGAEVYAGAALVESSGWSVDVALQTGILHRDRIGLGAELGLSGERRWGASALGLDVFAGYQGAGMVRGLFGPTYLAHRDRNAEALSAAGGRSVVGAKVRIEAGKWQLAGAYSEGLGPGSVPFDRTVVGLVEWRGLSFGATRALDLRGAYVGRGLGRGAIRAHIAQVSLRLRLASWLSAETYFQLGRRADGGVGLTVTLSV